MRYYLLYMSAVFIWLLFLIAPTYFAIAGQRNVADALYASHVPFCHQMPERSLCIFSKGGSYWVGDCVPKNAEVQYSGLNQYSNRYHVILSNGAIGYEFGEDARNTAIYFGLLFGGLLFPLTRNASSDKLPRLRWLLLALIPIALDGTTQLAGLRESTNILRILTGGITGIALSFYLIPLFNDLGPKLFGKEK